jgi:ferritin-like metal-binding protein YciE
MSETATSILTKGLRSAHAMESQALEFMQHQAGRLEDYPELQEQVHRHLAQTERQLERLEECLDALGEDSSAIRDTLLSDLDSIGAAPKALADDEILNHTFANYAFEHYEIAAYKSLLTLCEMAIQRSIAPLLQESLAEEEAMAQWFRERISLLTRHYISQGEHAAA